MFFLFLSLKAGNLQRLPVNEVFQLRYHFKKVYSNKRLQYTPSNIIEYCFLTKRTVTEVAIWEHQYSPYNYCHLLTERSSVAEQLAYIQRVGGSTPSVPIDDMQLQWQSVRPLTGWLRVQVPPYQYQECDGMKVYVLHPENILIIALMLSH